MFPVYKNIAEIFFVIAKLIWFTVSDANITSRKLETAKNIYHFFPSIVHADWFFYCMDAGIIYFLFLEKTSLKHLFWKKHI